MKEPISIESRDFWFKVVEMLQQNWALIEAAPEGVTVFFISDTGGVFDQLSFPSTEEAADVLRHNGFQLFSEDPKAADFLRPPEPPFHHRPHPNGPIYSSGRFWQTSPGSTES
jgi:hypothetical protein